jgi:hypothetical protein
MSTACCIGQVDELVVIEALVLKALVEALDKRVI